jgi:hypothetical protein
VDRAPVHEGVVDDVAGSGAQARPVRIDRGEAVISVGVEIGLDGGVDDLLDGSNETVNRVMGPIEGALLEDKIA